MILSILKFSGSLYLLNLHKFFLLTLLLTLGWKAAEMWILQLLIPSTIQALREHYERTALIYQIFSIIQITSLVFLTVLWTDKFASSQDESTYFSSKQRFGQFLKVAMLFSIMPIITYVITILLHYNLGQELSNIPDSLDLADYFLSALSDRWALPLALLIGLLALLIFCRLSLTPYFIILENQPLNQAVKSSIGTTKLQIYRLALLHFLLLIAAMLIGFLVITPVVSIIMFGIMQNYIGFDQLLANMNNDMVQPFEMPAIFGFLSSSAGLLLMWLLVMIPMTVVSYIVFLYLHEPNTTTDD